MTRKAIRASIHELLLQLLWTYIAMGLLMLAHECDGRVPNLGFLATLFVGGALRFLGGSVSTTTKKG
jgi:hypothetical protein